MINVLLTRPAHSLSVALKALSQQRHDMHCYDSMTDNPQELELIAEKIDAIVIPPHYHLNVWSRDQHQQYLHWLQKWIDYCQKHTCLLIWCYSDEIFGSGEAEAMIHESSPIQFQEDWIKQWLDCESMIRNNLVQFIIMRLGPLLALSGEEATLSNTFDQLIHQEIITASAQIIVGPTPVTAIAHALCGMLLQINHGAAGSGIYHLSGVEPVTCLAFMQTLRETFLEQLDRLEIAHPPLGKVVSDKTKRPLIRRVLDCKHILDTFGVQQKPWRLALPDYACQWIETQAQLPTEES